MTRVRHGAVAHMEDFAADTCVFCSERVSAGAYWMGAVDLWICALCVHEGQLGKLLGDAVRDTVALERALTATAREAWRSLALAQERECR